MHRPRLTLALALLVALTGVAVPSPATPTVRAASPVGAGSIVAGSVNRTSLNLEATYLTTLRLNWGTRAVRVSSTATIRNTSGGSIDRVEFSTVANVLGGMDLTATTVDGVSVRPSTSGQTTTVPLGGILPVGATTKIKIGYAARLRSTLSGSNWFFTKANGIANLYRWLPWVSRATRFSRPNHGDPFVTPSSPRVRVRITTDRKMVFATSGERVAVDGLSQTFEAHDVRDFTVTAATDFVTRTTTVGGTRVIGVARSGAVAAKLRDEGARAFRRLQDLLGPYPHPSYRAVQSAGGYGMESPAMSWLPYGLASSRYRYLVTHETAHQWFYGIVGNDQARQPFTDEAATDFVTRYILGSKRSSSCSTARLDRTIYDYSSSCYYEVVYIQGGNVIDRVRRRIGSTAFWRAMRAYVADHRNRIASTLTLLNALEGASSHDLTDIFAPRFPRLY